MRNLASNLLIAAGLAAISLYAWSELDRYWFQQQHASAFSPTSTRQQSTKAPTTPDLLGRIVIPKLDINVLIKEGTDTKTLRRAVGHVPQTAQPGQPGNVVLAAHRDTFFRPLQHIRKGDEIRLLTPKGPQHYRVIETRIVSPKNTAALNPTPESIVTLVTCFPFDYIGPAPQRFLVRAVLQRN